MTLLGHRSTYWLCGDMSTIWGHIFRDTAFIYKMMSLTQTHTGKYDIYIQTDFTHTLWGH